MSVARPPDPVVATLAARIALAVPPACEQGVREALDTLDDHWVRLRAALNEDALNEDALNEGALNEDAAT